MHGEIKFSPQVNMSLTRAGLAAKPILWEFLRQYPTPQLATKADPKELEELFQPLGLHRKRASGIIRFSGTFHGNHI